MKISKANGIDLKTIEASLSIETLACSLKIFILTTSLSTNDLMKIRDSLLKTIHITLQSMRLSKNGKERLNGPGSRGHALQKVIEECNHKVQATPRLQKYLTQEAKRGILKVKGNKELGALVTQQISEILLDHLATIRCYLNSNHHC